PEYGRVLVDASVRPGAFLSYAAGDYYIQDAGSMLAARLCAAQPGMRVWDCCASPGGKSTAILEQLGGQGALVANEVIQSRVGQLQLMVERAGFGNVLVTSAELDAVPASFEMAFDRVLLDAPCSGQSMVSKGKQSLTSFSESQISHSAARQRRLLEAAARAVAPGGRLVYSTCTFAQAENESVVLGFLATHAGWSLHSEPALLPWQHPEVEGLYRIWPHIDPSHGAFAAALVRNSDAAVEVDAKHRLESGKASKRAGRNTKSSWRQSTCSAGEMMLDGLEFEGERIQQRCYRTGGDEVTEFHAFPNVPADWIAMAVSGTLLARSKRNRIEPQYGAARLNRSTAAPHGIGGKIGETIEVGEAEARLYVEGQAVRIDAGEGNGWRVLQWAGRSLGWGKVTKGVVKNHFPKPLRQKTQ
ncbi:MAG: hypothetical protein AAGG44_02350, partial [Planctomycetota bacterium]